jgi:act minimal PKS acyl carrier protein
MSKFTLTDLYEVMRASTGVDEGVDLDDGSADVDFAELGYDSLAVLELASQVQRQFGVPIPDDVVPEMRTPRLAVELVNQQFVKAGA